MSKRLTKFFGKLQSPWLNRFLLITVALSVFVIGILYWIVDGRARDLYLEQAQDRQRVIARSRARSIEYFLELASSSLLTYESLLVKSEINTQQFLDDFISEWAETPIIEICITDQEGSVIYNANKYNISSFGVTVTERDYFRWAREAGDNDIYLSDPIISQMGPSQGKYIVTLSTPIIAGNQFQGVLVAGILLNDLTRYYLDTLDLHQDINIYLVDSKGIFLHSPKKELIGKSIFTYLKENPFSGSEMIIGFIEKEMFKGMNDGNFNYYRPEKEGDKNFTHYLLTYSEVHPRQVIGQKQAFDSWYLVIEARGDRAQSFIEQFYRNQNIVLIIFVLLILIISMIAILAMRISYRDGYLRGFVDHRDHHQELGEKKITKKG